MISGSEEFVTHCDKNLVKAVEKGMIMMSLPSKIACVCHEANRAWCEVHGDMSQQDWMHAANWQLNSALAGVKFLAEHPDVTEEDLHDEWVKQKVADGWTYGPEKDAGKKKHPCLRPYAELSEQERKKDRLFLAIVRALLAEGK